MSRVVRVVCRGWCVEGDVVRVLLRDVFDQTDQCHDAKVPVDTDQYHIRHIHVFTNVNRSRVFAASTSGSTSVSSSASSVSTGADFREACEK